jgi:DNA-binding MarR family transcriptional regulator
MANKRTIPEVRKRMHELADELHCDELHELAEETRRNAAVTKAKASSTPLTSQLAQEIREFQKENPELHQRAIAEHFNVNPGRVSEALHKLK